MSGQDIQIQAHDGGSFSAYLASPKSGQGPGLLVIQEIFGVNAGMRHICDHYASLGYFALSPDIFWRQEPGVQITDKTRGEWDKAFQLYSGLDVGLCVKDLVSTLTHLRHVKGCSGKVGVTGYCLGGKLTYLMACRSDADAAVSYYGGGIDQSLEDAPKIKKPILLHLAMEDEYINTEARAAIHKALGPNPLVTIHDYPGVQHAFARPDGQHYDARAATLANRRSEDFFARHLK